jgi:preprotein translocase subunit YajC
MDKYNKSFRAHVVFAMKVTVMPIIQRQPRINNRKTMNSTSKYAVGDVVTDEYGTTGKIQAIQHRYQIQGSQYSWIDEDEIINKVEALEQDAIQLLKSRGYVIKKIYDNE